MRSFVGAMPLCRFHLFASRALSAQIHRPMPFAYAYSAQGTYKGEGFLDAEQITKNKLYIYTREENTGFDRRFLMKRVDGSWKIDAVQERLDGWQRVGL